MNPNYLKRVLLLLCAVSSLSAFSQEKITEQKAMDLIKNVEWIDNACVKISGTKTVYFDPYNITQNDEADFIFITHDHFDHYSPVNIEKLIGENTLVIGPACVTDWIDYEKKTVKAGDKLNLDGLKIKVVPSYTIKHQNHEKSKGYVGYVLTMDDVTYYIPGDSDLIPEMKKIKTDVAFLPVCGKYMMDVDDALEAANRIKPQLVVPFHYGSVLGTKDDALEFKNKYAGTTVILDRE